MDRPRHIHCGGYPVGAPCARQRVGFTSRPFRYFWNRPLGAECVAMLRSDTSKPVLYAMLVGTAVWRTRGFADLGWVLCEGDWWIMVRGAWRG